MVIEIETSTPAEPHKPTRNPTAQLRRDLMNVVNLAHRKHRHRSYCGSQGTIQDKRAAESIYRNCCKSEMKVFEYFIDEMFRRWDTLECMEWARKKKLPAARTPILPYIANRWTYFFDEILGKAIEEKQRNVQSLESS